MKIVKGKTVEEQIKHIDTILDRFSRRLHKTTAGIISPYPISNFVKSSSDRVVLRYVFPIDGMIPLGTLHIDNMPKSGVDIYVVAQAGDVHRSETLFTKRQFTVIRPDVKVAGGTRLTVSVVPRNGEDVSDIWISLLWVPEIRGTVVKQFLIDELDRMGRENALSEEE